MITVAHDYDCEKRNNKFIKNVIILCLNVKLTQLVEHVYEVAQKSLKLPIVLKSVCYQFCIEVKKSSEWLS